MIIGGASLVLSIPSVEAFWSLTGFYHGADLSLEEAILC